MYRIYVNGLFVGVKALTKEEVSRLNNQMGIAIVKEN